MKIINKTNLKYSDIGIIIDYIIEHSDPGATHYYGQIEVNYIHYEGKDYNIEVRYLKRYCVWCFVEV